MSQISAAGAYARAERLAVTIPVRAIDPTRQRFQVGEQVAEDPSVQSRAAADGTDADGAASERAEGGQSDGRSRGGFGLIGAFTSFLARMFAQSDTEPAALTSAKAGVQAYARVAKATSSGDFGAPEVLSPSFPRLSSGRAVDLVI